MSGERANIFRVSAAQYGPEDRFTAHLAYLFDNVPELGQAWLDHLCDRAGEARDTFVRATKHAEGTKSSQPDFLIRGEREDILCEHKVGAALSAGQLENYLRFARAQAAATGRPKRLTFVTGCVAQVSDAVATAPEYLGPSGGPLAYFRWEELYPLVAGRSERLAREFAQYMTDLGLRPCDTQGWTDLLTNPVRRADFVPQWKATVDHFQKHVGAKTVLEPKRSLGLQIKDATPWMRQLYLKPERTVANPPAELPGPYIRAAIGIYASDPHLSAFHGPAAFLPSTDAGLRVLSRSIVQNALKPTLSPHAGAQRVIGKTSSPVWCWEYLAPLDAVLSPSPDEMRQRLLAFARRVYAAALEQGASGGALLADVSSLHPGSSAL